MIENAGFFMLMALVFNVFRSQRFLLALVFMLVSLVAQSVFDLSDVFDAELSFLLVATAHVVFALICSRINTKDAVITYMMLVSLIGIFFQAVGACLYLYGEGIIYYHLLQELIFALQIIGIIYGGVERNYIGSDLNSYVSVLRDTVNQTNKSKAS